MTPRQQEAHDFRAQGFTQAKIGELMGINQARVSNLLDLNKHQYVAFARYRKTPKGRAVSLAYAKKWQSENPEKTKALRRRYNAAHREKIAERSARYARTEKGRESNRKQSLKYYYANREEMLRKNAAYVKTPRGLEANRKSSLKSYHKMKRSRIIVEELLGESKPVCMRGP